MAAPHFLQDVLTRPGPYGLRIERTDEWLVTRLRLALSSAERRSGLLGRKSLEPGEGLVIAPSQGVHTFGMAFPIAIVGIARDGRVVRLRDAVKPSRLVFAWSAFAILEVAAGVTVRADVRLGDRLSAAPLP